MQPQLRRALSAAASASARPRRGVSTAASRPSWAMIDQLMLVDSAAPRASLQLAEPPRATNLLVPAHYVNWRPRSEGGRLSGMLRGASGDGLLLLVFEFQDARPTAPLVSHVRRDGAEISIHRADDPDIARFVCNPLSGELVRLPDIDGTKKDPNYWEPLGIVTQSVRGHGPPDRYAVADLIVDGEGEGRSFVMRRFFSETREWDKVVGLASPLPLPRRMDIDREVIAFAGRLWWVDLTWGAISADPFSDRPELSFVELPKDSVWAVPGPRANQIAAQGMYRRMGVSEGRLRYVEVSQEEPFVLSSFALDGDCRGWKLEHQVALSPIWPDAGKEGTPRIGVIDPLNASFMCVIAGHHSLAIDMDNGKVLKSSLIHEDEIGFPQEFAIFSAFLKPCVLPPWLGSSRIPSAGTISSKESRTFPDIMLRVDRAKKN
ncbi:hypothetical protein ACP70R_035523 [Stipagrostis hirtigluma subsp. patula]